MAFYTFISSLINIFLQKIIWVNSYLYQRSSDISFQCAFLDVPLYLISRSNMITCGFCSHKAMQFFVWLLLCYIVATLKVAIFLRF